MHMSPYREFLPVVKLKTSVGLVWTFEYTRLVQVLDYYVILNTRLLLVLGTLKTLVPVWSWYWGQDWLLAGMEQVHTYKVDTRLGLPQVPTPSQAGIGLGWYCLIFEISKESIIDKHSAARLIRYYVFLM